MRAMRGSGALALAVLIALAGTLLTPAWLTASVEELDVAVLVGATRVPLSVHVRFADVAKGLPKPGELPVEDAHARGHDARTYCYSYSSARGLVVLELHDSDFGLHTARIVRGGLKDHQTCPRLDSEPEVAVGSSRVALDSAVVLPSDFKKTSSPNQVTFERHWTYEQVPPGRSVTTCFDRVVSVVVTSHAGAPQSITVQNWKEPGC